MSSNNVTLYSYWRSSCSWRVRLSLILKGIDFEYKAVNLLKNEHTIDDYNGLNPMSELPTLLIDGHTLTQSGNLDDLNAKI